MQGPPGILTTDGEQNKPRLWTPGFFFLLDLRPEGASVSVESPSIAMIPGEFRNLKPFMNYRTITSIESSLGKAERQKGVKTASAL
jgi:hypothetical protein